MSIIENLTVQDLVRNLLTKHSALRDDDYRLIANVWIREMRGKEEVRKLNALEFLTLFTEKKLAHPESVRRSRQLLQERHEELRGERYQKRETVLEKVEREGVYQFRQTSLHYETNVEKRNK